MSEQISLTRILPWIAIPTTVPTRVNLFCIDTSSPRHVATIIAPGEKSIPRFKADVALIQLSPDVYSLLCEVDDLLSSYQAIANPQFIDTRRKIKTLLLKANIV
jgi:hypothetical protein